MSLSESAGALKAEGNAFYSQGSHKAAIEKYTAAINIASDNGVLFANRAASRLSLKQYEQARQDAEKATELDPTYAKGWGRLAAAFEGLNKYKDARDAYGRAIECIDATSPISDADKRMKAQYKSSHTKMDLRLETRQFVVKQSEAKTTKTPWELAKEIKEELPRESSGHVILEAAEAFAEAKVIFKSLTLLPNGMVFGPNEGIASLSNAIMTNERCIFVRGGDGLITDYNMYHQFEVGQYGAWPDVEDPLEVLRLAKQRLRRDPGNWDTLRGALSCQVRSWIIMGHLGQLNKWSREQLFRFFDQACTLIELGRAEWPDVHREDRGTIFDDSFLRGVQVLRMNEYMQAYSVLKHLRTVRKFTLDGLLALADEILGGIKNTPPEEVESMQEPPYFYLAFYIYPQAEAWSIRGFVYFRKALFQDVKKVLEDREWARKAGDAYVKAADLYPEDDENRCLMLSIALECYSAAKITARETLTVMERLRLTYPKMLRIWRNSKLQLQGGHKKFVQIMKAEEDLRMSLDTEHFTLDEPSTFQL